MRDQRRNDDGVTLIELVVACMVTVVMLAIVGSLFVNVAHSSTDAISGRAGLGTGANAMNEIRRVLRVATDNATSTGTQPAVVQGGAASLTVYSYVDASATNPAPVKVQFTIDAAGNLIEQRTASVLLPGGYWAFTGATTTRTLAGPLITTGDPLFTYLDVNRAPVPLTGAPAALASTDLGKVTAITVTTTVPYSQRAGSGPIQLTDTVTMTNLTAGVN